MGLPSERPEKPRPRAQFLEEYQNDIPTDNKSSQETHPQKTDKTLLHSFSKVLSLKDTKEHKSKLGKLRNEVTKLQKAAV